MGIMLISSTFVLPQSDAWYLRAGGRGYDERINGTWGYTVYIAFMIFIYFVY